MKLSIVHHSRYNYSAPVSFGDHLLRLRPRESHLLQVTSFSVKTHPESRERWVKDVFSNTVLLKNFGLAEAEQLAFECILTVNIVEENPFNFILDPHAVSYPFSYTPAEREALRPLIESRAAKSEHSLDWYYAAVPSPMKHPDTVQFLSDINQAIRQQIKYIRRDEEGVQSPDETIVLKTGSCRDMAWLFISICRQLGLAARFVSGYLYDPPVDNEAGSEHLFNRAVGAMHAWAEVYLPGAGWKGFDPTNGILANAFFIPCAVSIHPDGASPIEGKYFSKAPATSMLEFDLNITAQ